MHSQKQCDPFLNVIKRIVKNRIVPLAHVFSFAWSQHGLLPLNHLPLFSPSLTLSPPSGWWLRVSWAMLLWCLIPISLIVTMDQLCWVSWVKLWEQAIESARGYRGVTEHGQLGLLHQLVRLTLGSLGRMALLVSTSPLLSPILLISFKSGLVR